MTDDDGPGWRQLQEQEEREQQEAVEALDWFESFGAQHDSKSGIAKKYGTETSARPVPESSDQPFAETFKERRSQG